MPIAYEADRAVLSGRCTIEEAEGLRTFLLERDDAVVDLGPCQQAHLALLQIVRIAGARVERLPEDPTLRQHLAFVVEHRTS